jgi:hypothetical protein
MAMSAINGFIDPTKLNFLPLISSDEPIPEIDSIKKELGHLMKSAVNHFHPNEGTSKPQRPPRKLRGIKRKSPEYNDQSLALVNVLDFNLLLNSDGVGGRTKGVAIFEDLLEVRKGDMMLLCIPFVAGKEGGIFEKYRRFCENQDIIYSDYITCSYGSKKNRQQKGADDSPGDHLQIPVRVQSNPDGLKILDGEIDCAKALQSNSNPSLYFLFYSNDTTTQPTQGATHNLCQIFYSDVLPRRPPTTARAAMW